MKKPEMFTDELFEATSNLIESLVHSEPIPRFIKADRRLQDDQDAQQLIHEATELKQKLYAKESTREEMQENYPRFQALQSQISTNSVLQEQYQAHEMAIGFLREVNQEISQLLGVDFASLTRRPDASC